MSKSRAHLIISGRVQGVFYRANTKKQARRLGLTGWVKNKADGTVEVTVEGDKEKIEQLISWAQQGSPAAQVDNIDVTWQDYQGQFTDFTIRY